MMALAVIGAAGTLAPAQAAEPAKQAAAKETPKDIVLKGDARCTTCHDEGDSPQVLAIGKTRHGVTADKRNPTCTSCHGESEKHVKEAGRGDTKAPPPDISFGKKSATTTEARNDACLTCHEKSPNRMHWAGSQHESRDVSCTSCHNVHTHKDRMLSKASQSETCFSCHKTERAQTHRISTHPLAAGKMGCSDCHNPHGSAGPKLMTKESIRDTCFTCHAEKRGPFLWEHASATDDCMNCHTPHGSTNQSLLKSRQPWLCQQCHGDGAPHPGNVYSGANLPGGAVANVNNTGGVSGTTQLGALNPLTGARITQNNPSVQMALRGCTNCHTQVHGSNHPAGNRFVR